MKRPLGQPLLRLGAETASFTSDDNIMPKAYVNSLVENNLVGLINTWENTARLSAKITSLEIQIIAVLAIEREKFILALREDREINQSQWDALPENYKLPDTSEVVSWTSWSIVGYELVNTFLNKYQQSEFGLSLIDSLDEAINVSLEIGVDESGYQLFPVAIATPSDTAF
ncbi:MAG: hypothetical protein JNM28_02890 [Armatimonadetes bacterium]|nr:hypothetical protein [Armatimonadota bacterium]